MASATARTRSEAAQVRFHERAVLGGHNSGSGLPATGRTDAAKGQEALQRRIPFRRLRPYRSDSGKEFAMEKRAVMTVASIVSGSAACAAAPRAGWPLTKAAGLPCCSRF